MKIFLLFPWVFISISFSEIAIAQNDNPDSTSRQTSIQHTKELYFNAIRENALIYDGSEVLEYKYKSESHPFYLSNEFFRGSLKANGILYSDVFLLYDIVHDKLIVRHYNKVIKVALVSEMVEKFILYTHEFVRLAQDTMNKMTIIEGFYDQLYKGRAVSFYAKRRKSAEEQIKDMEVVLRFPEQNSYFIRKEGNYYPVTEKSSVLNVLKDKRKELQDFARKNNLRFRSGRESAIIRILAYYDSLKQ